MLQPGDPSITRDISHTQGGIPTYRGVDSSSKISPPSHHHAKKRSKRKESPADQDDRPERLILLNDHASNAKHGFISNELTTTKYTLFNLLPKAIFEQFRRLSNFYFLLIAIVSYIPGVSPTNPITNILPLLVVVGFGFARDVYEDTARRVSDKKINGEEKEILARGHGSSDKGPRTSIAAKNVAVGDTVKVSKNEFFPADLLLVNTSDPAGVCYVSTANLDGETNLKRLSVPTPLKDVRVSDLHNVRGSVECKAPDADLYHFQGSMSLDGQKPVPLDSSNLLLRGSVLKNTETIYGLVVYTGFESKVALNMRHPPSKFSGLERKLNFVVLAIFGFLIMNIVVAAALSAIWQSNFGEGKYYLGTEVTERGALEAFIRGLGTFFILLGTYIPVSLFVTVEFVHIYQGFYMHWDNKMEARGIRTSARSTNLNEMLGSIHHIFSDKTGTLTENVMKYVACSVKGKIYDTLKDPDCMQRAVEDNNEDIKFMIRSMALCHAVVPEVEHDESEPTEAKPEEPTLRVYQGQSPDEVALVEAARNFGAELLNRGLSSYTIDEFGEIKTYEILVELEFNSDRKRMSIIAREPDGTVRVYCKGADSIMTPLLDQSTVPEGFQASIDAFATEGLRTLVFGTRVLDESLFAEWFAKYQQARNSLDDREGKTAIISKEIEQNMVYVCSTAVEDKLQAEVPSTIQFMRDAGIRLWVLTGDKRETAENIGYSSRLLDGSMNVIHIQGDSVEELRTRLSKAADEQNISVHARHQPTLMERAGQSFQRAFGLEQNLEKEPSWDRNFAVIIDGPSLTFALESLAEEFLELADRCKSVICCRVTPLQKALVVRLVQTHRKANSLAIGDGGNDVSMIQEADVGIGVHGKEGSQAVRAADYSIAEFRFLRRLMSVHGRYSYVRTAGLINLSFYKNFSFTLLQFLFQFFNGFTGTTLHNEWYVTFYNLAITLLAPFAYALYERDLREETLSEFPHAYAFNREKSLFGFRTAIEYLIGYGGWHAVVVFFITRWALGFESIQTDGLDGGFVFFSLAVTTNIVFVVLFKFFLASRQVTSLMLLSILFGFVAHFFVPLIVSRTVSPPLFGVQSQVYGNATFWLTLVLVIILCFIADFSVQILRKFYSKNITLELKEYEDSYYRNSCYGL